LILFSIVSFFIFRKKLVSFFDKPTIPTKTENLITPTETKIPTFASYSGNDVNKLLSETYNFHKVTMSVSMGISADTRMQQRSAQHTEFAKDSALNTHVASMISAGTHTLLDIPTLFPGVFSDNDRDCYIQAATIAAFMRQKDNSISWARLSLQFKKMNIIDLDCTHTNPHKRQISEKIAHMLSFPDEVALHLLGIASMNFDGYLRQAATKALVNFQSPQILPYLLLRCMDWVSEVRRSAQDIIDQKFSTFSAIEWLAYPGLIARLVNNSPLHASDDEYYYSRSNQRSVENQKRMQSLYGKICAHMKQNRFQHGTLNYLKSASKESNLFYIKVMSDDIACDEDLMNHALKSIYPEVRAWVISYLPTDERLMGYVERLLKDKALRVRYLAVKAIPKELRREYRALYEEYLFDKSRKIREYARFVLTQLNEYGMFKGDDPAVIQYYHDRLNQEYAQPSVNVLIGWCDIAQTKDLSKVFPLLSHENARVRLAAFQVLKRLRFNQDFDLIIKGLMDACAKVRHLCTKLILYNAYQSTNLLGVLLRQESERIQKSALRVLARLDPIAVIVILLKMLLDPQKGLQNIVWATIERNYFSYASFLRESNRGQEIRNHFLMRNDQYQEIMNVFQRVKCETNKDVELLKKMQEFLEAIRPL
jgi:HEAT repeat protein